MDDILREQPADTTSGRLPVERTKGPEELVVRQRGEVHEDCVSDDGGRKRRRDGGEPAEQEAHPLPEQAAPAADDAIDEAAAAAAVAAEADTVEIEESDLEEGLPAVPELADAAAVARVVFVLMLTSREGLSLFRLAQACNTTQKLVEEALVHLSEQLRTLGLPVELARNGDVVKWISAAETFAYLQRLRGVKKLEKLSPAALETLAVIAYRQPVMRSEIEAIRGVKAGPMLRTLLQHKLVKVTGRADVPGRPLQYGTTPHFLERFGIASLQELPSIKEWKNLG
jgi:segregation and condensation protein B